MAYTIGASELFLSAIEEQVSNFQLDLTMSTDEFVRFMSSLGYIPSSEEITLIVEHCVNHSDTDTIDFESFFSFAKDKLEDHMEEDSVLDVFQMFEGNYVTPSGLQSIMSQFGKELNRQECTDMIKEADLDGDGKLDYFELSSILRRSGDSFPNILN